MPIDIAGDFVWLKTSEKMSYCCMTARLSADVDCTEIVEVLSSGLQKYEYYCDDVAMFGFGDPETPFDLLIINRECEVAFVWANDIVIDKPINMMFASMGHSLHEKIKRLEDIFIKNNLNIEISLDKIGFQTSMLNEA